jgi:hypothetical protein
MILHGGTARTCVVGKSCPSQRDSETNFQLIIDGLKLSSATVFPDLSLIMCGPLPSVLLASLIESDMNAQTLSKLFVRFSDANNELGKFNATVIRVQVMTCIIKFSLSPIELRFLGV